MKIIVDGDATPYSLLAWVIMPNHVHVLVKTLTEKPMADYVTYWKKQSTYYLNRSMGTTGPFWQREYFDRFMRDERHLFSTIRYIHLNPLKAGLVDNPLSYPFSSARVVGNIENMLHEPWEDR